MRLTTIPSEDEVLTHPGAYSIGTRSRQGPTEPYRRGSTAPKFRVEFSWREQGKPLTELLESNCP